MDSYLKANVFAASNFGTNSIFTSALNVSNKGSPLSVPQLLHNQHVGPAAAISSDVISALEQYKHLLKTPLNSLNSNHNFGITNESTPERVETCLSGININSGDDYLFENQRAHHEPDFIQHSDSFGTARSTAHLKRSTTTLNKRAINNNNNMQLSSHNEINIIPNRAFRENDIMKMGTKNSVSMENIPTTNLPGTNHISKQHNEITPGIDSTSVSSICNNDNNFMVHNQTSMVELITPNNQNSKLLHNKSQCLSSVCSDVQKLNTTSKLLKSNQKKNRACPSDYNLEISLSGWMKRSRSKHNSGDKAKLCNENIGSAPVAVKMQNTERNIYNQDLKPQQKGYGNDCLFDENSHSLRNNTMKRPTEDENDSLNLKRTKL
ncbi:putative uncharacterized protein DDB_G0282133 [Drosophila rhopaloa]|uniref:Uncharacterized protein n=1 Tax=Drosophila rhopaloa TaxID=1041015 RepID=A0ABM5J8J6_DRORH|nr:putative uncharacterized protein DDB_G0282133 [Drosophila rhopaloa]